MTNCIYCDASTAVAASGHADGCPIKIFNRKHRSSEFEAAVEQYESGLDDSTKAKQNEKPRSKDPSYLIGWNKTMRLRAAAAQDAENAQLDRAEHDQAVFP